MAKILTIFYATILLVTSLPAFSDPTDEPPLRVRVSADVYEVGLVSWEIAAEGNAKASYGDEILAADRIVGNQETGEMEGSGNVLLRNRFGTLTADSVRYGFMTGVFEAVGSIIAEHEHETLGDMRLTSTAASGNLTTGDIAASGEASLTSELGTYQSETLAYNIRTGDFGSQSSFRAEYRHEEEGSIIVSAAGAQGNAHTGHILASGDVLIDDESRTVNAQTVEYNARNSTFMAEGDVEIAYTDPPHEDTVLHAGRVTGSTSTMDVEAVENVSLQSRHGLLTASDLIGNLATLSFTASGIVELTREDEILVAETINRDADSGLLTASGNVTLRSKHGTLKSETLSYDPDTTIFHGTGHVSTDYMDADGDEMLLSANNIEGSTESGDMQASGDVYFRSGGRSVQGDALTYNYGENIGIARHASGEIENIYFSGEEIESSPGRYLARNSRFTTCDADHPHFHLSARELIIEPDEQLVARDVSLNLLGHRLLTIPRYSTGLAQEDRIPFRLPSIGFNGRFGAYAGYEFDLSRGVESLGVLDVRVSSQQAFQGGLMYDRIAGLPIFARGTYRQPTYSGRQSDLLVSRLPEVGIRFHAGADGGRHSTAREPLTLQRGLAGSLRSHTDATLNMTGEVGIGYFVEDPGGGSSGRADARAVAWLGNLIPSDDITVSPGVSARYSNYGNGDTYSSLGVGLMIGKRFGPNSYASLAYTTHSIHGDTPFEFDRVELTHELSARYGFTLGDLKLELGGRYDLQGQSFFDTEIAVARRFHCIEPRLTWNSRFRELSVGVSLVGF